MTRWSLFLQTLSLLHHFLGLYSWKKGVAEEVLARLKEEAEIVIIDSPPMLARSDAFRLASIADGVIVVADANRTRTSALRRTLQYVEQARAHAGSRFLGVVLNRFQPPRIAQYVYYRYYGGYYGYHEQYGSEPERVQEKTPVLPLPEQRAEPLPTLAQKRTQRGKRQTSNRRK